MNHISQRFAVEYHFNIHFTEGLFQLNNDVLINTLKNINEKLIVKKILIFIDAELSKINTKLLSQIEQYFQHHAQVVHLVCSPILLEGGEKIKIDEQYFQFVLQKINLYGIDRHSYIMAIGGGAFLDMVGYASAIAHRGIRLLRVPTTMLSQDDSGVGVKNSINYFSKKNFLGTFAPPYAVFNDYQFIETLSTREFRCGIAEAIKVALIKDAHFFAFLYDNVAAIMNRDKEKVKYLIYHCAKLHSDHIASGDPFELGSSRPLDFGHWSAHKLEQISDYTIKHGEAVATGIALDVCYSALIGLLPHSACEKILDLLMAFGFNIYYPQLLATDHSLDFGYEILNGLNEFREHLGGQLTIMLLKEIGSGVEVNEIDESLVIEAVKWLKEKQEI